MRSDVGKAMEKLRGPALGLLLLAAFCLRAEAAIEEWYYITGNAMTWDAARDYCVGTHRDLGTMENTDESWLSDWMNTDNVPEVWLGLHRDPENDYTWRWINVSTGVGLTGPNLTSHGLWDSEYLGGYCAAISGNAGQWASLPCSTDNNFYCSDGSNMHHVVESKDWYTAQSLCKSGSGALATVTEATASNVGNEGWIGLYRQGGNTWTWLSSQQQAEYTNWAPGEPHTQDCGWFDEGSSKWMTDSCATERRALCVGDNLRVVKEEKTWEEALAHCRNLGIQCSSPNCSDLLTLTKDHEYDYVRDRINRAGTTDEVWVGLRFAAGDWWGADGQLLNHKMSPDCPSPQNHCGIVSRNEPNKWDTRDCGERKHFVCIVVVA